MRPLIGWHNSARFSESARKHTARTARKAKMVAIFVFVTFIGLGANKIAHAEKITVDSALFHRLERIIVEQKGLLKRQSDQLTDSSQVIETLKTRVNQLEKKVQPATAPATAKKAGAAETPIKVVTSGSRKIKLSISGHVNQAINIANDGNRTKAYFVDNDVTNSRIRFVGTGKVTPETTIGVIAELGISPNNSSDVSQNNETSSDAINMRKAEVYVRNNTYGQLRLGRGQAAADDTAEHGLSLVNGPIMSSAIADIAGGLQFTDGTSLSDISVGSAFSNFDGNRQNRLRYDSPTFGPGFQLSGSVGADQRYDAAITWGGDYGDWTGVTVGPFTTLGALSIREPNVSNVNWRLAGSWSMLHKATGISLMAAGGMDNVKTGDTPYNIYGKLGWDTKFFSFGPTGFGADFTYSENVSASGDQGTSVGLAAVQVVKDFNTELYTQYRIFDLDRSGSANVEKIHVGTVGARVKF